MYFEGIYISERVLLTHTCMHVYKTLNAKMDKRHKSCRVLFYLDLFLLPREKIWVLAMNCLMTTLQFSLLQVVFWTLQRCILAISDGQWPGFQPSSIT